MLEDWYFIVLNISQPKGNLSKVQAYDQKTTLFNTVFNVSLISGNPSSTISVNMHVYYMHTACIR